MSVAVLSKQFCKRGWLFKTKVIMAKNQRPASDMAKFKEALKSAKSPVILTGAGVSAESGIPTFRGAGGFWRKYDAMKLATPQAFAANPSLVWEFYHYRRELAKDAQPNPAHYAISEFEKRAIKEGKNVTIVTQNIDNLHAKAGSNNIIELHGSLYKTKCTKCRTIEVNKDSPICEALAGRGAPDPDIESEEIHLEKLPRCKKGKCNGLLRPHIVWFGESLESHIIEKADNALRQCDICIVIGTSSLVYPAAMFAPQAAARGVPVAEFNIETTPSTYEYEFYFEGKCGTTIPEALAP